MKAESGLPSDEQQSLLESRDQSPPPARSIADRDIERGN